MNSKKDFDDLMKKYNEAIAYSFPKFMILPFIENRFNEMNKLGMPLNQPFGMNPIPNKNIQMQQGGGFPKFPNMTPYSNFYFKLNQYNSI